MELTYKELKKRDVVNVVDGKCLGHLTNLKLTFPSGKLTGIFVAGKRGNGIFRIFDKSEIFISEKNIIKIGGDVILVNLKCGESIEQSVNLNPPPKKPVPPCPPPCPPSCPPPCPPSCPPFPHLENGQYDGENSFDLGDY